MKSGHVALSWGEGSLEVYVSFLMGGRVPFRGRPSVQQQKAPRWRRPADQPAPSLVVGSWGSEEWFWRGRAGEGRREGPLSGISIATKSRAQETPVSFHSARRSPWRRGVRSCFHGRGGG